MCVGGGGGGGGEPNFLVNSSQVSYVGRLIIFSLLESWYIASKPVFGLTLYKLKNSVLTSSLKLSVLCERLGIRIWLAHCESWLQVSLRQSCRLVGMVAPRSLVGCSANRFCFWFLDSFFGNG